MKRRLFYSLCIGFGPFFILAVSVGACAVTLEALSDHRELNAVELRQLMEEEVPIGAPESAIDGLMARLERRLPSDAPFGRTDYTLGELDGRCGDACGRFGDIEPDARVVMVALRNSARYEFICDGSLVQGFIVLDDHARVYRLAVAEQWACL